MRSHEERVAETKRRIAKIEREKRLRRNTITMASAVAACLALLIGVSLAMPGIAASIQTGDYSGFETAASIFHGGAALGYIVIGLLAFLLGVCVSNTATQEFVVPKSMPIIFPMIVIFLFIIYSLISFCPVVSPLLLWSFVSNGRLLKSKPCAKRKLYECMT